MNLRETVRSSTRTYYIYIQFYAGIGDRETTEGGGLYSSIVFGISCAHFAQAVRLKEEAFAIERKLREEALAMERKIKDDALAYERKQMEEVCERSLLHNI